MNIDFDNNDQPGKRGSSTPKKRRPGRPTKHDEPTEKLTVVFTQSRFTEIKATCFHIYQQNGSKLPMTALIRGISEAVLESDIDLEKADNEEEIYEIVSRAIQ